MLFRSSCIKKINDKTAIKKIKKQHDTKSKKITVLKADYPYVSGISNLEKLDKSEIICYGKYYTQKDRKNCESCDFVEKCKQYTELINICKKGKFDDKSFKTLKLILD